MAAESPGTAARGAAACEGMTGASHAAASMAWASIELKAGKAASLSRAGACKAGASGALMAAIGAATPERV
jgi:hypothetical protein